MMGAHERIFRLPALSCRSTGDRLTSIMRVPSIDMFQGMEFGGSSRRMDEKPLFPFEKDSLGQMRRWLEEKYPFFQQVEFATSEDPEYEGGTCYIPEGDDHPTAVILMGGAAEDYAKLKWSRPDAMQSMAELLGTTRERLDGETIQAFVFLHEAGHLFDYFANFLQGGDLNYGEATDMWIMNSDAQLESLPIPGLSPSDLRFEMRSRGGLGEWRRVDPELDRICTKREIWTEEELVRVQEIAYRLLPKEEYADMFAAKALKDFFEQANGKRRGL